VSERRALAVVCMSPSALRYAPAQDRNHELRSDPCAGASAPTLRCGDDLLYVLPAGVLVNHKRVERLYSEAQLQMPKRKRKKIPLSERQPLVRPQQADQVWSMDFVFDRSADGRTIKCLTIVDDVTHECVGIVAERAIGGSALTRILDKLHITRGLPQQRASTASSEMNVFPWSGSEYDRKQRWSSRVGESITIMFDRTPAWRT